MLFTCGWMITAADEDAIRQLPADAWKPGHRPGRQRRAGQGRRRDHRPDDQGGELAGRAALDRAAREAVPPPDAQPDRLREEDRLAVLGHLHQHPGHRDRGRPGQPPPAVHRRACTASTPASRPPASAPRRPWACAGLPSKTWQVNCGWVAAANIAADLAAWTRLLGHCDDPELRDAGPVLSATGSGTSPRDSPGMPASALSPSAPTGPGPRPVPGLLAAAHRPARTRMTSTNHPHDTEGGASRRGRSRCWPRYAGQPAHPPTHTETDMRIKKRMPAQSVTEPQAA